jgi:peptidyl-tRNA hydrolase
MKKVAIRAIEDDSFREAMRADPAKAAASMGELAEIKELRAKAEAAGLRESKVLGPMWASAM